MSVVWGSVFSSQAFIYIQPLASQGRISVFQFATGNIGLGMTWYTRDGMMVFCG